MYKKIYESGLLTGYINIHNTIKNLIDKETYIDESDNENLLTDKQIEILEIIQLSIEKTIEKLN